MDVCFMTVSNPMKKRKAVKVTLTEFIEKEPPGLVKGELVDCKGKKWSLQGKPLMFTTQEIDAKSEFPLTGLLSCKIEAKRLDGTGKMVLLVDTARWVAEESEYGGYFEVYDTEVVDL